MSLFKRKVESIREKEKERRQVEIQKKNEEEEKIEGYEKIRIDTQNCLK
ncbi:MAG: hypothetical protein CEO40_107 [Parcubacteria group bacterium LiPW_72]|nr:MAG: hypothetical protein CEO40_107 [Parcubacteria group bacterium LiPW_72]